MPGASATLSSRPHRGFSPLRHGQDHTVSPRGPCPRRPISMNRGSGRRREFHSPAPIAAAPAPLRACGYSGMADRMATDPPDRLTGALGARPHGVVARAGRPSGRSGTLGAVVDSGAGRFDPPPLSRSPRRGDAGPLRGGAGQRVGSGASLRRPGSARPVSRHAVAPGSGQRIVRGRRPPCAPLRNLFI